jgi:hypothetical protein
MLSFDSLGDFRDLAGSLNFTNVKMLFQRNHYSGLQ